MMWRGARILWGTGLLSAIVAVACSSGSVGSPTSPSRSGVSSGTTTIRGTARTSSSAHSVSQLASHAPTTIRICVNGTNTCADVDGAGNFVLTGRFSGSIELRISSPQGTAMLTIPDVKRGETIVVVVNLEGTNGGIQILSRNGGHDDDSDDDSSDDTSSDDNSSDDDSSDDTSGSNNQGQSGGSGS